MKQVLLYSILLGSLLIGFVACSSDDPEIMGPALGDVNGDYQNGSGSKALEIYYSDKILNGSNKTVTFSSEDKQTAIITLKNVIPGVDVLELPEVLLTSSKDQTQFLFSGTCSKTDCMVTYDGTVEKGKLTLSLTAKLFANDDVVGRWILQKIQKDGDVYKKQPVFFTWTTTEEFPGFKIKTSDGYNLTLSCTEASRNLGKGFSEYMEFTGLIKEITLTSDGNIKMVYASGSGWQESELNVMRYYIRGERFYLQVDESVLSSSAEDEALLGIVKSLLQQYEDGIPFGFDSTESGKLSLYLDSEVLASTKVVSMMPLFKNFLPAQSDYFSISLLQNVFENYSTAIKATTKIQLGLNFSQVKQGAK